MMSAQTASARTKGRAVAYLRCSTAEQAESRNGLEAQQAAIASFAARQAFNVAATFTDAGISGAAPLSERNGLMDAIAALRRGDVLIVGKLDRLSRAGELETAIIDELIQRRGARVLSAAGEGTDDDTPTGQLLRDIVKAFSRHERSLISSRTRSALQAKKARGEKIGAEPYGATDAERAILETIADCRTAGFSFDAIAAELNRHGFTTRRGTPWRAQYVRSLILTATGARTSHATTGRQTKATRAAIVALTRR